MWYSRWRGNSPKGLIAPETFPDVASLRKAWQDLEGEVRAFVKELGPDGINRRLPYKHFAGKDDTTVVWQMLQHVVNHGTYHRGQVTTLLRQLGLTPPKGMDLIFFYREREAQLAQGQSA